MKFVIQLDSGKYVKKSAYGWRLDPLYTEDANEAEVWVDQKAAVAWCEEQNVGASIVPIEVPVVEQVKPKVRKINTSKATDESV